MTIPISEAEAIPRQALTFVSMALDKMKSHYDAVEETRKAAASAYALMAKEGSHKKRKAVKA